jgi:hypothetical protein
MYQNMNIIQKLINNFGKYKYITLQNIHRTNYGKKNRINSIFNFYQSTRHTDLSNDILRSISNKPSNFSQVPRHEQYETKDFTPRPLRR